MSLKKILILSLFLPSLVLGKAPETIYPGKFETQSFENLSQLYLQVYADTHHEPKDEIRERTKQYRLENKDEIRERKKRLKFCIICKSSSVNDSFKRHTRTKKHIQNSKQVIYNFIISKF